MKKSFFNPETERFTEEGVADANAIEEEVAKIFAKYIDKYSAREIEYVICQRATMAALDERRVLS